MLRLYTAPWCAQCKPIKKLIEAEGYDVTVIDVDTEGGGAEATELSIRGLPTLTTTDGDRLVGPEPITKFLKEL